MAEWLRRVIRNHLGSSRAGSNPVQCAPFIATFSKSLNFSKSSKELAGLKIKVKVRGDLGHDAELMKTKLQKESFHRILRFLLYKILQKIIAGKILQL